MGRSRSFWVMRYREARVHAILLASVTWVAAAIIIFTTAGYRDRLGHLKGADFVHFYTLGRIALIGDTAALYDTDAQHQLQARLVPESAGDLFLPIYPPQTALLFAPFARFSYGIAALLWALTSVLVYALGVRAAWRAGRAALPDAGFVTAAAAAFPPFWSLVLHGQTTALPFAGFCLAWIALDRARPFVAGLALGLLALKPQFGLVLAAIVLVRREWGILLGIAASVGLQLGAACVVMGTHVLTGYVGMLEQLPRLAADLEPRPYQLHSIRAITSLLPSWIGTPIWALLSVAVVVQTLRVWRTAAPVGVRLGVLIVATLLVSPHVTIYDATVLALPLLWVGAWIGTNHSADLGATYWPLVYWLFAALFFPTALLIRVQASVVLLVWLFVSVTRVIIRGKSGDAGLRPAAEV